MAAENRDPRADLTEGGALEALAARAPRAELFALAELLEHALGERIGYASAPREERFRFRHAVSLAFAASDVRAAAVERGRVAITTTILGAAGTSGPVPLYLVEEIVQESEERPVRRDLLDVFHHRAISLLIRVVLRTRPATSIAGEANDRWSQRLLGLAGASTARLTAIDRLRILPLLATARRSASGLAAALRVLLAQRLREAPQVKITELAGARTALHRESRARLGRANHVLGRSSVLGASLADPSSKCLVSIGPVGPAVHARLLPGGDLHRLVRDVFALFDPGLTDLELDVRVRGAGQGVRLGDRTPLGQTSWLASARPDRSVRIAVPAA